MKKPRVLLITFDFPPIISGIATVFYNIWRFLPSQDYFILAPKIGKYKEFDRYSNLRMRRYFVFSQSRIFRAITLFLYALRLIIQERIKLLICAVPLSAGFVGFMFKKMTGMPYCVFYYGGEFKKYRKRKNIIKLLRLILNNAHFILSISEYAAQEAGSLGVDKRKIVKLTPGVDIERFHPGLNCSYLRVRFGLENKKIILTVSRLVRRKGIDIVINALPRIIKEIPNIAYLIIGKGEQESFLKKLVAEKALEKNVVFIGAVPDEELPKYYNLCDAYVMPNRETEGAETLEGFGISFIEASACAKPAIGGISGGASEAVLDGRTGLLVDPEDFDAFVSTLIRILKDGGYAAALGRYGRERVEKEFTWQTRAERLENLFHLFI